MGRILMTGGGGGADLDVITAEADDILSGKVIVDKDGNPLTGTLTLSGDAGVGDVLSGKTFYTTNPKSKQTGTMGTMGGGTYTPKAAQQTVSCSGKKMTGNIVIKGDGNLVAGNIRKGKSVFGVSGNVNAYRSGFKQINSNGSGYITISPGFYITAWVLMKVGDANNVSITVPWNAKDTIVLPGCPAYTVSRSGNSITIKVYSANAQYNCYYTGYDN